MAAIHFDLPENITAKKLIANLGKQFETHLVSQQYLLKTYYDSFDWRLYKQDIICEFNRSKQSSSLRLTNRKNNELIASTILFDVPSFSKQFNPGKVRQVLEPVLGVRALQAICTLECEAYHLDIIDKDEKTLLRVVIEEFNLLNNRLTLYPVKGNGKIAKQVANSLFNDLGLQAESTPVLVQALSLQGRKPKDYSPKLNVSLSPEMPAETAAKTIFGSLLRTIKQNEQGVIADTDSEFLHEFRIAIRKTRVGLNQLKNALPQDKATHYKAFFAWLGQATNESRDLDVYLLNFEDYKKKLPASLRQDINPLQVFLAAKKQKAHRSLVRKLRSKKYLNGLAQWEEFLAAAPPNKPTELDSDLPIKQLADVRIRKTYKQILKQGKAIGQDSPSEALHELRKNCKKLRYLLEFFQSLYSGKQIDKLIKNLKKLQAVLGDYQDYAVQQKHLQAFSEEMQAPTTPSKTFLAMDTLIQYFDNQKQKARNRFAAQFEAFKKPRHDAAFRKLFET